MKPTTLYIIGNGFDRYHRLDTRYQSFAFFLQRNYSDLYELLIQYYNLPDLDPNEPESYYDPLWAEFENGLADLDIESILEDKSDYLANISADDFSDRDWYAYQIEMEIIIEKLTTDLCEAFRKFILSIEYPESIDNQLLYLERNAIFLSFNYTDTLEKYYFIKSNKVLHIHGYAKKLDEEIVLGHGIDPDTFKEEDVRPPDGLSKKELELWREQMSDEYDFSYETGKKEIMSYFSASFKYTEEIIKNHETFFSQLSEVDKIIVLGHSLANVDEKYFIKVLQSVNQDNGQWIVSYYSETERNTRFDKLKLLGIKSQYIKLIKIEELKLIVPTLFD